MYIREKCICFGCGRTFKSQQALSLHYHHVRSGRGQCTVMDGVIGEDRLRVDLARVTAERDRLRVELEAEKARAEAAEDRYGKRAYDAVMALHRKSQQEAIDATARANKAEALTKRAVDILVAEELDRDFGEEPSATTLAVRAIMAEMGLKPETCSMGAVIGYSGTTDNKKDDHEH